MTDGEKIVILLRETATLFGQVGALLSTADALMEKADWTPLNSVAVTGSNAVYKPTDWLPQDAHRFYCHSAPAKSHLLTFVSVILWDRDSDSFMEPLACGGCLDYGIGNPHKKNYWYWYSRLHTWMPDRRDDGTTVTAPGSRWPKWKLAFQSASTFAVPLVSLRNAGEVQLRVVEPLLRISEGQ